MHGIHCILCVFMKAKQIDTYDVGIIIEQSPNRYVNVQSLWLFVCPSIDDGHQLCALYVMDNPWPRC